MSDDECPVCGGETETNTKDGQIERYMFTDYKTRKSTLKECKACGAIHEKESGQIL